MNYLFLRRLFDYAVLERTPVSARVRIRLNARHAIYGGHFPGNPITPGVCSLQIVEEVLASLWGCSLRLRELDWIKYLAFIDPREHPEVELAMQFERRPEGWKISGQFEQAEHCFVKLRALYEPEQVASSLAKPQ